MDHSNKTENLIGKLCLFRETGLRCVVTVIKAEQRGDLLYSTLLFKAVSSSTSRPRRELVEAEITVSALKEGMWNQVWMIHPLSASTIDEAIQEVDPDGRRNWIRG